MVSSNPNLVARQARVHFVSLTMIRKILIFMLTRPMLQNRIMISSNTSKIARAAKAITKPAAPRTSDLVMSSSSDPPSSSAVLLFIMLSTESPSPAESLMLSTSDRPTAAVIRAGKDPN